MLDELPRTPAEEWIECYWDLVEELVTARQAIDVAALKRDYGPRDSPIPLYDDKLDDEIEIAQQDLDWFIPVPEDSTYV